MLVVGYVVQKELIFKGKYEHYYSKPYYGTNPGKDHVLLNKGQSVRLFFVLAYHRHSIGAAIINTHVVRYYYSTF